MKRDPKKELAAAMRRATGKEKVDAMRDGRRQRAYTFPDKKKAASKSACRGNNRVD